MSKRMLKNGVEVLLQGELENKFGYSKGNYEMTFILKILNQI